MNCKEFEKQIPDYQADKLSTKKLTEFMTHLSGCSACQEELAIHYLVHDGIMHLEDGKAFDLQQIMDGHKERSLTQLKKRRFVKKIVYGLEVLIIAAIITVIYLIISQ
ncbi:MAG: zf-HC2 domain-containing protein [Lachnospiraceae bacterium]|nr:zf-HC2 domain-containing protein [Lachnospiraceae bacterium]